MKRVLQVLVAVLFLVGTASADIVAGWDMYGQPGDQVFTSGYGSTETTAFNMVRGSGLAANSGDNSFNSKGWDGTNAEDYIEFGFSVLSGYSVTLEELWIGTRSSNTGPGTLGVYTSLDGYTNPIYEISQIGSDYSNSIIDLSSLGSVSGDFYVRLIEIGDTQADGSGATAGTGTFRVADYYDGTYIDTHFEGTISPVPIPAAVWLLGSGLIGLVGVRRKNG